MFSTYGDYKLVDQPGLFDNFNIEFDIWYSDKPGYPKSDHNLTTLIKAKFDYLKSPKENFPQEIRI